MDLFLKFRKKVFPRNPTRGMSSAAAEEDGLDGLLKVLLADQVCRRFSLDEIKRSTENFNQAFVVGRGGFGTVYKALIDGISNFVAIKRCNSSSKQGAQEFYSELEILLKLRHCNLVSLIGYCNEQREMILVYEYMPHGTLADHLHGGLEPLSWLQRLKICIGAAHALDYLHTGTGTQHSIVHSDVKTSNILLDENFAAKFSDFGLAKVVPINQTNILSDENFADNNSDSGRAEVGPTRKIEYTAVRGTLGYIDPSHYLQGRLSTKSDVYSFGVVLLEMLCGRPASDRSLDEGLARWAQDQIKLGKLSDIVDYRLSEQISNNCLNDFAQLASRCLHDKPDRRPTMTVILYKLHVILSLQERSSSLPFGSVGEPSRFTFGSVGERSKVESNPRNLTFRSDSSEGEQSIVDLNPKSLTINGRTPRSPQQPIIPTEGILKPFSYDVLKSATGNFRADSILGEYSHGSIYKGWIRELSLTAAIKRLEGLNLHHSEKWLAEIDKLGQLNHPNLVKLIGYCLEDDKQLRLIVYEFMPGGTLEQHLFSRGSDSQLIPWNDRIKVILDAAKGLAFVHNQIPPVALGHFLSSNILFDSNHNARILNLCVDPEVTEGCVSRIFDPESLQYNAPEYIFTGRVTRKSQIYGFGKVLLEVLTGMPYIDINRPCDEVCLADFAMPYLTSKRSISEIMDSRLRGEYSLDAATRVAKLVMKCLSERPFERPTADELVKELEELQDLQEVAKSNEGNEG